MPFVKGQSGNPGGMPKDIHDIKVLAARHGPACVEALAGIALNPDTPAPARVAAINALLDRGFGKPKQEITGEGGGAIKIVVGTGIDRD